MLEAGVLRGAGRASPRCRAGPGDVAGNKRRQRSRVAGAAAPGAFSAPRNQLLPRKVLGVPGSWLNRIPAWCVAGERESGPGERGCGMFLQ